MTGGATRPVDMTDASADRLATLHAPAQWAAIDFISDTHLHASDPETARCWTDYLEGRLIGRPDALFILGDLFEVWIGDDVLEEVGSFAAQCVEALRAFSHQAPVFFMCGNRDFLLGERALAAGGMQGLADPTVLEMGRERYLLSHGDALCLADTDYLAFRALVRSSGWQQAFLSRSLAQRQAEAQELRARSEAKKRDMANTPDSWADVDSQAASHWLQQAGARTLIHGHTHRPGQHDLERDLQRVVLSDWDATACPPRAQVLRLSQHGLQRLPLLAHG